MKEDFQKKRRNTHFKNLIFVLFHFLFIYLPLAGNVRSTLFFKIIQTTLASGNFKKKQFSPSFPGQKEKHVPSSNIVTALGNFESTYQHVQVEVRSNVFSQYANILEIESHFEKVYRLKGKQ